MKYFKTRRSKIIIISIVAMFLAIVSCILILKLAGTFDTIWESMLHARADDAISRVISDQKDKLLENGTTVKIKKHYYLYENGVLSPTENISYASRSATLATTASGSVGVFLLPEDAEAIAYTSSEIQYQVLINPTDRTVPTYTYSQVNASAQKFLDEVSYEGVEDSESQINNYIDPGCRNDSPLGYTVELKAGELTVFDNATQRGYTVTVKAGPHAFYNITPGIGGEFYVMQGTKIVQRGHLRPTGTLKMIHSYTPQLQNMRDLGGWSCDGGTVKYNLLIRGGTVINITDTDRNTWVQLLGIKHDVFLKAYEEVEFYGKEQYRTSSPLGEHISLYQCDLTVPGSENKLNLKSAKEQMNGIMNQIFDNVIAEETTYFHCLAGADRTGMVTVLIEGVLGISRSDIDKDYELTSFVTFRERCGGMYVNDIHFLRQYNGNTFRDKCVAYLLDCGISLEKINAFRNAMIDGNPETITVAALKEAPKGSNLSVPNGDGWIDDGRCSSKGADRFDSKSYVVTNYFPVENGDIVYVKNLALSDRLYSGMYASDKTPISGFTVSEVGGAGFIKDILFYDEWIQLTVDHADAGYLRLCGIPEKAKEDIVICIMRDNEWLIIQN